MPFEAVTLFDDEYLGEDLNLGRYRLQKGCEGEITEPIEACEKLYVVADGKPVAVINDYSDLSVYVRTVESAEQAKSFVRLLTSFETFHLFDRGRIEIDCQFVDRYQQPAYAQIDREDADRLHLHPIEVFQTDDGFRIKRCLYVWEGASDHPGLQETVERVGFDAIYSRSFVRTVNDITIKLASVPATE